MLAISGMIVSADAYGPIVDNARGIAEMAGMDSHVITTTDTLDAAGNTAKAITKGFSISAAALTRAGFVCCLCRSGDCQWGGDQPQLERSNCCGRCVPGRNDPASVLGVDHALGDAQCL